MRRTGRTIGAAAVGPMAAVRAATVRAATVRAATVRAATVRAATVLAGTVLLATGCAAGGAGGLADQGGPGSAGGQVKTLVASGAAAGPATITRPQAEALGRTLLARAVLPAGATASHGRPPAALAQPPSTGMGRPAADLHRLWTVAEPMGSLYRFWSGRVPAGMAWNGSGQSSDHGTITEEWVGYAPKRLPAGVNTASLTMSVAPAGAGRSVIRADVQVIWYPPRSAAEYIPPGTRAVTITATTAGPRPRTVTKTITSPSAVRRLAAMLNDVYAMPRGEVFSCPAELATYRLAFAKSAGTAPFLVATDTICPGVQITAGGHGQPELQTPPGLQKLVDTLTHITLPPTPLPRTPLAGGG
jgi:hypothetical protein